MITGRSTTRKQKRWFASFTVFCLCFLAHCGIDTPSDPVWNMHVLAYFKTDTGPNLLVHRRYWENDRNVFAMMKTDGTVKWEVDGAPDSPHDVLARLDEERIYIFDRGRRVLYSLDHTTGELLWDFSVGKDIKVAGWLQSSEAIFVDVGVVILETADDVLQGFDGKSGKLIWRREYPELRSGLRPIHGGNIMVTVFDASKQGKVVTYLESFAITSGETIFKIIPSCDDPVIEIDQQGDELYFVAHNDAACREAYSLQTGELIWRYIEESIDSGPDLQLVQSIDRLFLVAEDERIGYIEKSTGQTGLLRDRGDRTLVFPLGEQTGTLFYARAPEWDDEMVTIVGLDIATGNEWFVYDIPDRSLEPQQRAVSSNWDIRFAGGHIWLVVENEDSELLSVIEIDPAVKSPIATSEFRGEGFSNLVQIGNDFWMSMSFQHGPPGILRFDTSSRIFTVLE